MTNNGNMSLKKIGQVGKVASSNLKETEGLILARFENEFLVELMKLWPDRERNRIGLTQKRLAELTGIGLRSIASYCNEGAQPDRVSLRKLGEFFGIHWVEDFDNSIDMSALLKRLKALIPPLKAS